MNVFAKTEQPLPLRRLIWALCATTLVLSLALLATPRATAQDIESPNDGDFEFEITCTDLDNVESCDFGNVPLSQGLGQFVLDIVSTLNAQDRVGVCEPTGPDTAICDVETLQGQTLSLDCTSTGDPQDPDSASCSIANLPPDFFEINCEKQGQGGACTLSSDGQSVLTSINSQIDLLDPQARQFISVGRNLLSGCLARGGVDAFQRDCDSLLAAIANGDTAAVGKTLVAVTPLNVDNTIDTSRHTMKNQMGHSQQRMSRVRSGNTGVAAVDVSGLRYFDGTRWLSAGDMMADNHDVMTDAAPAREETEYSSLGFFVDGTLISSEQDSTAQEADSESDTQTLTLGVDYLFSKNVIGGLAFSAGTTSTDYGNNRGDMDTTSFLVMAYGSYFGDSWYIDATLALGGDEYDQTRVIDCSANVGCVDTFRQEAEADFYGSQVAATFGGGYDWNFGGFGVGPYVQLAATRLEVDGYRETIDVPERDDDTPPPPGSGYALDIDDQERDLLTLTVGAQFNYVWSTEWGVVVPHLDVEYIEELEDDSEVVNGRFVGNVATDDSFELATTDIDTEYFSIGLGVAVQFSEGNAAFINVKTWEGNDEVDLVQYTAGWRWEL